MTLSDMIATIGANGVIDKPANEVPDATEEAKSTGLQAMVGPFRVEVFERVLQLISSDDEASFDDETTNSEEWIDPRFILATAWDKSRFENAKKMLDQGREAPPIEVTGNRLPGLPTFFSTTDGMHRVVAARIAGHKQIRAKVTGYWICDPTKAMIINGCLWKQRNNEWTKSTPASRRSFAVCDAAAVLGVKVKWPWWLRLYRRMKVEP